MKESRLATRLIHHTGAFCKHTGAVSPPIYQVSTFRQDGIDTNKGYDYSRTGNPTREVLESYIAELEGGIKTLELRVKRQNRNGQTIAEYLESHPRIEKVFYPGLESHPQHDIAIDQMSGYGGVVTFLLDTDFDGTARFIDALQIPQLAPSLGGVESLVEPVAAMGYWDMPADERRTLGIYDSLVRLSLGIEDENELIGDLEQALKAIDE
jgi:cystathionine beta-lyase/cystathionine gamma-synthase